MKVLILAGGKNKSRTIKPLICILGKPVLDLLINKLNSFDIYLNIHEEDYSKLKHYENKVHFLIEDKRTGKAKPIRTLLENLNEDILVVHCDIFTDLDFNKFIDKNKESKELMVMVVKNINNGKSFGVSIFDTDKKIYGFTRERYINTGIYLVKPDIKEYIDKDKYQDIDLDLIPKLIKNKEIKAYIHNGFWWDVGTKRVIEKFNKKNKEN